MTVITMKKNRAIKFWIYMPAISYHITFKQYEFPIMLQDYASLPKEAIHMNTKIHNWYIFLIHLWTKKYENTCRCREILI